MTAQEALRKLSERIGTRFAVTGPDYGQCTAIPHDLQRNILKIPIVYGDAKDIYDNAGGEYAKPQNPEPGDIVVWKPFVGSIGTGWAGHVAVVSSVEKNGIWSIDQNWPDGTDTRLRFHPFTGIKGYLRPKAYTKQGGSMNDAERNAKASAINGIYWRYLDRGATEADIKAWLGANLDDLENRLRNPDDPISEEHRHAVIRRFKMWFGADRVVTDKEVRERTPYNLLELDQIFANSEEFANRFQ